MATATELAREVQVRVNQKMTVDQIVQYINRSLAYISSAGSWPWDLVRTLGAATLADRIVPIDLDAGKHISCFNSGNKLPIIRTTLQDAQRSVQTGFVNLSTTAIYNTFIVNQVGGAMILEFYPLGVNGTVDYYYHQLPPQMTNNNTDRPRWLNNQFDMDMLLIECTEAEVKKVLGMPDAMAVAQRVDGMMKAAAARFCDERVTTGPMAEAQATQAERTQIGVV